MTISLKKTDVVLIGVGGAGGIAALPLAEAGLEVIGLEAGPWFTPRDFAPDEVRNSFHQFPGQKTNDEIPTHRPNASSPNLPRLAHPPMFNAVGGSTVFYSAQSWRLNPWDFKVVSETTRRYGASRIPRGSTVEDWPFGLEELEPYYDKVEYVIGVAGKAGNIKAKIDTAGNIFEGPRAREYPMPPLRRTDFIDRMADAARKLGWHPFPGPAAVNSQPYQNRPTCTYHGFCSGGGCHVNAKGSTAVTTIPKAVQTGHFKLVTQATVTSIPVDKAGRVSGAVYLKDGQTYFQPASVVLLACYTYENTRMLLLSTSKAYPRGLSNNHGQVGKHYFSHNRIRAVTALFPWNLNSWYGLLAQGVGVDDWADDNFDHAGLDFIGGGNLFILESMRPISAASMNTFGKAPRWGAGWKAFVKQNAGRWNTAEIQKTTLPYEDIYLDLDPTAKDPLGYPVCRITGEYRENEKKVGAFMQEKMVEWFMAAGAVEIFRGPVGAYVPNTHTYGGTRMGDNPETNVANRWGFSHEVPNLGILGASVMGTSGSRNPTLTVQALAWRTADHLVQNWKTISE
jgi:gluconate 2-dehydrogenase alpha chain